MFPIHERNVDLILEMIERINFMMLVVRLAGILTSLDTISSMKSDVEDCRAMRCNFVSTSLLGISPTGT